MWISIIVAFCIRSLLQLTCVGEIDSISATSDAFPMLRKFGKPIIILHCYTQRSHLDLRQHGIRVYYVKHDHYSCQEMIDPDPINRFKNQSRNDIYKVALRQTFARAGKYAIAFSTVNNDIYEGELLKEFGGKYHYHIAIAPNAYEKLIRTKPEFKSFMRTIGLSSYIPAVYSSVEQVHYPVVLKTQLVDGFGGNGVSIVSTSKDLLTALRDRPQGSYILEQFVNTNIELCYYFVAHKGVLLSKDENGFECLLQNFSHPMKTWSKRPLLRLPCSSLPRWNEIVVVTEKVVQEANFSGVANVDMRWGTDGRPMLLEFNSPRFCIPDQQKYLRRSESIAYRVKLYYEALLRDNFRLLE